MEFLGSMEEKYNCMFTLGSSKILGSVATISFNMRDTDERGLKVFSDYEHITADMDARSAGVEFKGNLLGSHWRIQGDVYTIIGYNTRRPKYPVILLSEDGEQRKCSFTLLVASEQYFPSEYSDRELYSYEEFLKWVELDPESDTISPADEELVDAVNDYITFKIEDAPERVEGFFDLFSEFETKKGYKKLLPDLYAALFVHKDMREALSVMINFKK